ncbi:HDIG domain-containing protein [Vallitaleaceae bacterium 9-2]
MDITREKAWELLTTYTKTQALQQHALAVEAVMRHFAEKEGEDVEKWGIIGLLHDLDYEQYPEQHCEKVIEILTEHGYPQEYIHAICSHGYGICSKVKPEHTMEKILYTIDELTGLINATCLMRPSKSVLDLKLKSVKKKFKTASFASGVNREVILNGCDVLGVELDDIIQETIAGMQKEAEAIGLKGTL